MTLDIALKLITGHILRASFLHVCLMAIVASTLRDAVFYMLTTRTLLWIPQNLVCLRLEMSLVTAVTISVVITVREEG